jgi:hypothetical protein
MANDEVEGHSHMGGHSNMDTEQRQDNTHQIRALQIHDYRLRCSCGIGAHTVQELREHFIHTGHVAAISRKRMAIPKPRNDRPHMTMDIRLYMDQNAALVVSVVILLAFLLYLVYHGQPLL